jgi:hypothetical protein
LGWRCWRLARVGGLGCRLGLGLAAVPVSVEVGARKPVLVQVAGLGAGRWRRENPSRYGSASEAVSVRVVA